MRAMLCGCGARLQAADDDGLVRETLEHYKRLHGMAVVDGEAIRQIVEKGAYGPRKHGAVYEEDPDEDLWFEGPLGSSGALTQTYKGYGGEAMWPADFGPR